jgi:hypothetical protein
VIGLGFRVEQAAEPQPPPFEGGRVHDRASLGAASE